MTPTEQLADVLARLPETKKLIRERHENGYGRFNWNKYIEEALEHYPSLIQVIESIPAMLEQAREEERSSNDSAEIVKSFWDDFYAQYYRQQIEQARCASTQIERRTLATVVAILLEGKSGAAYNAVCEDYPAFAELVGRGVEQAKREAFLEAAKMCCRLCRDGYERARGEHLNRNGIGNIGICRANNIHRKLAEGVKE